MIQRVLDDPFIPLYWGKNQKGMQAEQELTEREKESAQFEWLEARKYAIDQARRLLTIGVHKQLTNRLLEPFLWQTVIVTATEWDNWDALRRHKDAQPEIKRAADLMWDARVASVPTLLKPGEWHLPLTPELDDKPTVIDWEFWKKVSTGRCARISYLTHDGKRDLNADIDLGERLRGSGHMSPFEHIARPLEVSDLEAHERNPSQVFRGNFRGFLQYRKELPFEENYAAAQAALDELDC